MGRKCEVSVICNTYNQIDYICKALDSILSQKVSFEYEVIVHDDASTDGTTDIIREYETRYPDIIKAVCEEENQYSQGKSFFRTLIDNHVNGKYIALCEGDDYWIDNDKLRLQYEALENHPECDMCACWGCTVTEDGKQEVSQIRPRTEDGILSMEEVILGGGQYLVTAGLVFRRSMCDDMLGLSALDYSLQMLGALRGGMVYIDRKMAVYRRYSKGSWTNRVLKDDKNLKIQWDIEKRLLQTLDDNTEKKYHDTIIERLKAYRSFEEQLEENKTVIVETARNSEHPMFIWGLGRRGKSLERFFDKLNISVDGVCDAINENIGTSDEYDNRIVHTEYVLKNAKTILASTRWAYDDLKKADLNIKIIDFQQYMPFG